MSLLSLAVSICVIDGELLKAVHCSIRLLDPNLQYCVEVFCMMLISRDFQAFWRWQGDIRNYDEGEGNQIEWSRNSRDESPMDGEMLSEAPPLQQFNVMLRMTGESINKSNNISVDRCLKIIDLYCLSPLSTSRNLLYTGYEVDIRLPC